MSKVLKNTSWAAAIAMVVACYGAIAFPLIAASLSGETDPAYESAGMSASAITFETFLIIVPILQVTCIVLGIIAAVNKTPETMRTTRAIMLTIKLSLIPFFIGGGILIAALTVFGITFPLIWGGSVIIAVCGWITVVTGSVWSIATAVHLHRQGRITKSEMAVHIVLQFFFVADVIDAIVLFLRAAPSKAFPSQITLQ